ncbi:MAG: hypothetical protein M1839_002805 [Geoglossum umbratile]|nr:MAG: hypothetical protein M1839_002805 [Geoglossum umbratile]
MEEDHPPPSPPAEPPAEQPPQSRFSRIKARLTCPTPRLHLRTRLRNLRTYIRELFRLSRILGGLYRWALIISCVFLMAPLTYISAYTLDRHYYYNYGLELLVMIAIALTQPAGSLLLAPATNPGRLYKLNPLVWVGDTLTLVLGLLRLRYATQGRFSWATAARVLVLQCEAVDLSREQVREASEEESARVSSYKEMRDVVGFPPLRTRGVDESAAVSIIILTALVAFVGQTDGAVHMLGILFALSFIVVQGTAVISTTRTLEPEEDSAVEDEMR